MLNFCSVISSCSKLQLHISSHRLHSNVRLLLQYVNSYIHSSKKCPRTFKIVRLFALALGGLLLVSTFLKTKLYCSTHVDRAVAWAGDLSKGCQT